MKYLAVLFILVVGYKLPGKCLTKSVRYGDNPFDVNIVGGHHSRISKFPYTASISYNGSLLGSGAIVNKRWIVCSASQLESYEHTSLTVRVGSDYWNISGQVIQTDKFFTNIHYTGGYSYDVAVVKLSEPIKFNAKTNPIKLTTAPPKAGCKAVVTGWGKQSPTSDTSTRLQMARVTVKPVIECQASHPTVDMSAVICADANDIGPCYGDKGDPLVCGKKLIGHFIGGNECNLLQYYELYSNISQYRRWIMRTIVENSIGNESEGIEDDE